MNVRRIGRCFIQWWTLLRLLGFALLVLAILIAFGYLNELGWLDRASNVSTELASIAITILVVDTLYEHREREREKKRLILQMGSPDNAFALEAVRALRSRGWLRKGSLKGADLRYANLQGANLRGADLQEADMRSAGVPLFGPQPPHPHKYRSCATNLRGAILEGANLQGANLTGVDLQEADLRFARLQKANLSGANLRGAALGRAQLQEADLRDADLQKADLNDANLEGALADEDTVWPEGFEVPEGVVIVDFWNLIDGGA